MDDGGYLFLLQHAVDQFAFVVLVQLTPSGYPRRLCALRRW